MKESRFKLSLTIWILIAIWVLVVLIFWRACHTTTSQIKTQPLTKPKSTLVSSPSSTEPGQDTFEFATRENRFTPLSGGNRAIVHVPFVGDVEGSVRRDVVIPRPAELEVPKEKEWMFSPKLVITDDEGFLLFLRWDTPHVRWAIAWEEFLKERQKDGYDAKGHTFYNSDNFSVIGRARIRLDDPKLAEICAGYAFMRHSSDLYAVRFRQFANTDSRYEADSLLICETRPGFPKSPENPEFRRAYSALTLIRIDDISWNVFSKLPRLSTWCRDADGSEWWCTDPESPLPNWRPVAGTPAVEKAEKELKDPLPRPFGL